MYAYTEATGPTGWKGRLRLLKYRFLAYLLSPRLDGVLATGKCCADFFRTLPGLRCPVETFGYFDGGEEIPESVSPLHRAAPRLLVAGQLIHRKGVDRLLRVLALFPVLPWELHVAGDGPERVALQRLAARLGIARRVRWMGVLDRETLRQEYQHSNCLLLPSRWDGWGMAVNEALREGCPVRATVTSGAADLLPDAWRLHADERRWDESILALLTRANDGSERSLALHCAQNTRGSVGAERFLSILGPL